MTDWTSAPCESTACLELAADGDDVLIRESGVPDLVVRAGRDAFAAFTDALLRGVYSHLL
jgi:hypothetical protein